MPPRSYHFPNLGIPRRNIPSRNTTVPGKRRSGNRQTGSNFYGMRDLDTLSEFDRRQQLFRPVRWPMVLSGYNDDSDLPDFPIRFLPVWSNRAESPAGQRRLTGFFYLVLFALVLTTSRFSKISWGWGGGGGGGGGVEINGASADVQSLESWRAKAIPKRSIFRLHFPDRADLARILPCSYGRRLIAICKKKSR